MKLTACYITKNEERVLAKSLASIAKQVDEIILVDTGSSDATMEIARGYGARVSSFVWQDDFAAARNAALEQAGGDWIVFLDADEYFTPGTAGNLRRVILAREQAGAMACLIKLIHIDSDAKGTVLGGMYALRVFRNLPELRYVGRIHEELRFAGDAVTPLAAIPPKELQLEHTGYSTLLSRGKAERNLNLLLAELATTDHEERLYGYLADAYLGLGDLAGAAYYARLAIAEEEGCTDASRPYRILLQLLGTAPQGARERLQVAAQAAWRFPALPEFRAEYAASLAAQGDYAAAVKEMEQALRVVGAEDGLEISQFTPDMLEQATAQLVLWRRRLSPSEVALLAGAASVTACTRVGELLTAMDACQAVHDADGALQAADMLLLLQPQHPLAMERAASLYVDHGDAGRARRALAPLLAERPCSRMRLFLLARIEYMEQNYAAAICHAKQALELQDGEAWQAGALHNILGRMYRVLGDTAASAAHYLAASRCPEYPGRLEDCSNYLLGLHYREMDGTEIFQAHCAYQNFFAGRELRLQGRKLHHQKLRIGYISPDMRQHVVLFFTRVLFRGYDRSAFEVYCYANQQEDEQSRQIAAEVDSWRNIRQLPVEAVVHQIQRDEIDILVDLAGHTADNSLAVLACRPAPVQLSGIGYFDTTGLRTVDYFLTDGFVDPPGQNDGYFTERLLRLLHSHFCYDRGLADAPVVQHSLCEGRGLIFGCLNNFTKVSDAILRLWAGILAAVPKSRLLLKGKIFELPLGRQRVRARLAKAGIPFARVDLEGYTANYLQTYQQIDIALDTYPYPGGGTTCDALYMGVPVITLVGQRHGARFGYSLLMNMGLGELCAFTPEEYVAKAVALAGDTERLQTLHQTLRRRMRQSPLMDEGQYMAELEQSYQRIWQEWQYEGKSAKQEAVCRRLERKLERALQREDWAAVRCYGSPLTAIEPVPTALCRALGLAYAYSADTVSARRAVCWLRRALQAEPLSDRAYLYGLLAEQLAGLQDDAGAYAAMQQARSCAAADTHFAQPEYRQWIYSFSAKLALRLGYAQEAMESYHEAVQAAPDIEGKTSLYSSMLLCTQYLPLSSAEIFSLTRPYAELFADVTALPAREVDAYADGRLHIGYLSADFRQHVLFAFYYALLFCCDQAHFHVSCYSRSSVQDGFTEQIKGSVDAFIDVSSLSFEETAQRIREDGIDILVDLAGHSAGSGLPVLAWRPAPVQISGLGYMATTGLPAVDYFFTDAMVDPPGNHEKFFTEKLLYLPSQFSYTGRSDVPEPTGAPCRARGYVVFGVFNRYQKITDELLEDWRSVLEQVPGAYLLLKSEELGSDSLVDLAYARLKRLGLPMERVLFEPATQDYMERYMAVDIALDTYPYPGGGTTCDALYMGVPVITRYGERRNTRFGLSILQNIGLGELAVASREEYIARAVGLAQDVELLDVLHQNLRQMLQNATALEPRHYMHELEQRYQEIWRTSVHNCGQG